MAVNKNPYEEWQNLKTNSDYRSTDTQLSSLTRQQLSQSEYLTTSNRVNPGPLRNTRVGAANSKPQLPHPLGSEDMWGWQQWPNLLPSDLIEPNIAEDLLEVIKDSDVPGKDYSPYGEEGGAST